MSKSLIIYHADCTDGWCAAWLMRKHLLQQGEPEPEMLARTYGGDLPHLDEVHDVYIVDFSYSRVDMIEFNRRVTRKGGKLLVLDHHKTAQANCEGLEFCEFDLDRSGAGLVCDRFSDSFGSTALTIATYVEDRDLWVFEQSKSKEINAYLQSLPFTIEAWDELEKGFIATEMARMGEATLQYRAKSIELHEKHVYWTYIGVLPDQPKVLWAPYVCCSDKMIVSELLNRIAAREDNGTKMAVGVRIIPEGRWEFSIRSTEDGPDVSEIAKQFGGGGHKHAAGWRA